MSIPTYERYTDAGIEWLGEVPEHWEVKRLKEIALAFPSNVDKKAYPGQDVVRLCNYTDVYHNEAITAGMPFMMATASADQVEKFTLRAGDTIFTKDSETANDIAIAAYVPSDLPGVVCGYHLSIARPKPGIEGAFIKRCFDSHLVRAQAEVSCNGLTRVGLSQSAADNLQFPVPPKNEQRTISAFLNQETAKIDVLIEEQRRLIELLKEKRQAVISHAVTKGLNAQAPTKDSGTDWFSTVPCHWQPKRLGQVSTVVRGASPRPAGDSRFFGGEYMPWITVGEVTRDENMLLSGTEGFLTEQGVSSSRVISSGTLIMTNSGATLGVPKILKITGCANDGVLAFLDLREDVSKEYLYFFLASITSPLRERVKQGSGQPNLNTAIVSALPFPNPPFNEQQEIATFLAKEWHRYAAPITSCADSIGLLQERRSALISAAVTGKIDIRNYVPPETAAPRGRL